MSIIDYNRILQHAVSWLSVIFLERDKEGENVQQHWEMMIERRGWENDGLKKSWGEEKFVTDTQRTLPFFLPSLSAVPSSPPLLLASGVTQ